MGDGKGSVGRGAKERKIEGEKGHAAKSELTLF